MRVPTPLLAAPTSTSSCLFSVQVVSGPLPRPVAGSGVHCVEYPSSPPASLPSACSVTAVDIVNLVAKIALPPKRLGRLFQHPGYTLAVMLNEVLTLQVPECETPRPAHEAQKFRHRMLRVRRDRPRLVQLPFSHKRGSVTFFALYSAYGAVILPLLSNLVILCHPFFLSNHRHASRRAYRQYSAGSPVLATDPPSSYS